MYKVLCDETPSQSQTFLLLLRTVHKLQRISFCWEGPHVLLTLNLLQINKTCYIVAMFVSAYLQTIFILLLHTKFH